MFFFPKIHLLSSQLTHIYSRTKAFLNNRAGKKVVGFVGWLAKSKLAKPVSKTDFAKKVYEKAYEKFRKMPIILKIEIQSVKGNLAVNIPPPPTNRFIDFIFFLCHVRVSE